MQPRKLTVGFAHFPYGGNGGFQSEHPDIRKWFTKTILECSRDGRIDHVASEDFADTPITMTRNRAVQWAKHAKLDVLVMVDSDMAPDCELGTDPLAEPFFRSSFNFLYERFDRGPVCIAAPYCGPPPLSNVYVFRVASWNNEGMVAQPDWRIEALGREESSRLVGIPTDMNLWALPTGLIMFDMRLFDLMKPPYFYYEWKDESQSEKASTEDVVMTRDAAMMAQIKLGYNPLLCNWSAWAGHWKPALVRKPKSLTLEDVEKRYREAASQHGARKVSFGPEPSTNGHAIRTTEQQGCEATDLRSGEGETDKRKHSGVRRGTRRGIRRA